MNVVEMNELNAYKKERAALVLHDKGRDEGEREENGSSGERQSNNT